MIHYANSRDFNQLTLRLSAWNPMDWLAVFSGGIVKKIFAGFFADESGAIAIEYGLIAAGISLATIAAVNGLGSKLNTNFSSINTSLK